MGNTSRRKPKPTPREPGGAPIAKPAPPRFAVVRHVTAGVSKIDVLNLDHVVHAVAHAYGEEHAIEIFTHGDLVKFPMHDEPRPITYTGEPAANLLAHLILCGIDVEGAPAALARARGDLYAPYFKGTATGEPEPVELPDPVDEADPGACKGCAFEFVEPCAGWIPGGLDDACGAFEPAPPGPRHRPCTDCLDYSAASCFAPSGMGSRCPKFRPNDAPPVSPALFPNTDCREAYDRLAAAVAMSEGAPPPPAPPISVEEHAAELRAMRKVEAANAAARTAELDAAFGMSPSAAAPIAAAEVERLAVAIVASDAKTAHLARKAAAVAAFDVAKAAATAAADKMHRARTCTDCVRMTRTDCKPDKPNGICDRFELNPRQVAAERVNFAKAARLVCPYGAKCERFPACADCSLYALGERTSPADPHHVEEVTGEHRDVLAERVGRCGVFVGMQARGVEIGKQWCGVGHEMTDPACALCPYLRIASR